MATRTLTKTNVAARKSKTWKEIDQSVKPKRRSSAAEKRAWAERLKYAVFAVACLAVVVAVLQLRGLLEKGPELLSHAGRPLPVEQLIIETDGSLPRAWIERRLEVAEGANLLSLDLTDMKERLESIGQVASAEVERRFPDTLYVSVSERVPEVRLLARDRDGSKLLLFVDESGTVFEGARIERSVARSLPYINGVALKREGDGFSTIEDMRPISRLLGEARAIAPHLYSTWRVISPADRDTLRVKNHLGAEITFSQENEFRSQLAKLDYITDYYRGRLGKQMAHVDLTLGDQVPVKSTVASR